MLREVIEAYWLQFTGDAAAAAEGFYAFKRAGGFINDHRSYVLGQTRGMLPKGWDATKHNVAIFNSSEDEFAAFGGEYDQTLYINQTEAMHRICAALADDPEVVLWLRIHPNLSQVHWSFAQRLLLLEERFSNVRVIRGDSRVSTYDLLDACNTVVSFGSTVGVEAAYWGKPSIMLGRCIYECFGSVYVPSTHEEAVGLMRTRGLAPLPRDGAIKVAVFWSTGGHSTPYFTGNRTNGFLFKECALRKTRVQRCIYTVAKFIEKILLDRFVNYHFGATRRIVREYRRAYTHS
jgi:hypothetical protein